MGKYRSFFPKKSTFESRSGACDKVLPVDQEGFEILAGKENFLDVKSLAKKNVNWLIDHFLSGRFFLAKKDQKRTI